MAGRRFSVEAIFKAKDQWSSKLSKMGRSVGGLNKKLRKNLKDSREFGKTWDQATAGSKRFGKRIAATSVVVGAAAGAALKNIVDEGAAFEKTMAVASAKFGDQAKVGTDAFKELEAAALSVGENTEMSADQAAGALKFMAMAGEDPTVAMNILGDAANFATAGEVELARATDVMSDAMGPMMGKVEGADAKLAAYKKTMDLMTFATTAGNQGLEEMFEATKMGAAGFRAGGQDIEQFAAATAVLSKAGIKGSKAGKDLARIMDSLTAPSKKAKRLMAGIKFTPFEKKDGKMVTRDFDDMMKELGPKLEKLSDPKRARFISEVIGKNSKASALALMENADALTTLTHEAEASFGVTAKQAKGIRNTTEGMLKGMDSSISAVKLEIFQVIKDDLKDIVKSTTEWVKANKGAISREFRENLVWVKDNYKDIVKWGKRIGKAVAVFVAMDLAVKGVRTTLMVLQGIKWGAGMVSNLAGSLGKATKAMDVAGSGAAGLNTKLGNMSNGMRGAHVAGGLAAAAFVGWEIGKLINELTGADDALAKLLVGMDSFVKLADKMNKREATTNQEDFLQRQKDDLAALKTGLEEERSSGGRMAMMGLAGVGAFALGDMLDEETLREIERQESLIARLEEKKAFREMGVDTDNAEEMGAAKRLLNAQSDLEKSQGLDVVGGREAGWFEGEDSRLAEVNRAQAALDKLIGGTAGTPEGVTPLVKLSEGMPANVPFGQTPAQVPPLPEKGMSREQLEQMLLQQAQMIQELQKGNTRKDRLDVTITGVPGLGIEGETDAGAVKVERTGTGV